MDMGLLRKRLQSQPCRDVEHTLDGLDGGSGDVGADVHLGPLVTQTVIYFLEGDEAHEVAFVAAAGAVVGRHGDEGFAGGAALHLVQDAALGDDEEGVGLALDGILQQEQLCKRVAFLNRGKVVTTGVPSEIVGQLGAYCVENAEGTHLFQNQEEALDYLRKNGGKLRDTSLEDVFFRLSGGTV